MSKEKDIKEKYGIDNETRIYMANMKKIQLCVWAIVVVLLLFFIRTIMYENAKGMKEVALAEVREAMEETVHNTKMHIDSVSLRVQDQAMVDIMDLMQQIESNGVISLNQVLKCMQVCDENYIGYALEVLYRENNGEIIYVSAFDRDISSLSYHNAKMLFERSPVGDYKEFGDKSIAIFISQENLDTFVKEEMRNYLHSEQYDGNQYIWVNEIIDMNGGMNYAVRKIHPSMPELEGEFLSTYEEDAVGNHPYKEELNGIKKEGKIFHSYYFKNKLDDEVTEKYSYAEYYEPFKWIIATGETLEDVYAHSESISERNMNYLMALMLVLFSVFAVTYWLITKLLDEQAYRFKKRILAQSEILEDMYTTMAVGLIRVKIAPEGVDILKINPRGLELLGINHKDIDKFKMREHIKFSLSLEEAEAITNLCWSLNEQWESCISEYNVKSADGSIAILNVRITLVEIQGDSKTLQIIYQDVTEERKQQEMVISEAEEKATLDLMTGIKNKQSITEILQARIEEVNQSHESIAIGFVDIDDFRDYNTNYGHLQGDEVIKSVASILSELIPGDVGRMGGDEFAFCVVNVTSEQMEDVLQRIRERLNEGIVLMDTDTRIPTPCSIGVAIDKGKDLNYEEMVAKADEAMYVVKEKGKNTHHIVSNINNSL